MIKQILIFTFLAASVLHAQDTLNRSFSVYLSELRISCKQRDTAAFHRLIGDTAFGFSCYGLEMPRRYNSDWETFARHFQLMNNPEDSPFWECFTKLSENGFYTDTARHYVRIPAFNSWGITYAPDSMFQKMPMYAKVFYTDSVRLYPNPHGNPAEASWFYPEKVSLDYPYDIRSATTNHDYRIVFEGSRFLGYVSARDVIYWNFQFGFEYIRGKWKLTYYEVCPA